METPDLHLFSDENLLKQLETVGYTAGCYIVTFYAAHGLPSATATDTVSTFYLYPSGGSLRDADFNIVFYSARFDTYRGFVPPDQPKDAL